MPVKQRFPTGWRTGALVSLISAVSILICNLIITIWVGSSPNFEANGAVGTLFVGSCTTVRRMNIWIHLLVNVGLSLFEQFGAYIRPDPKYVAAVRKQLRYAGACSTKPNRSRSRSRSAPLAAHWRPEPQKPLVHSEATLCSVFGLVSVISAATPLIQLCCVHTSPSKRVFRHTDYRKLDQWWALRY